MTLIKLLSSLIFLSSCFSSLAQTFTSVNAFGNRYARSMVFDSTNKILYVVGDFDSIQGITAKRVAKYNGSTWDSIFNNHISQFIENIHLFDSSIYLHGNYGFYKVNNDTAIRYSTKGETLNSIQHNDTMIIMGDVTKINGIDFNGVAKMVDDSFFTFKGFPQNLSWLNFVCAKYYKKNFYVGGNFHFNNSSDYRNDIMLYDGKNWLPLSDGIKGDPWVNDLVVFNNELYVAGNFSKSAGNISDNIMRWDGKKWLDAGGGVSGPFGSYGQIFEMKVIDTLLFVAGAFTHASNNEIPASGIAAWNGKRWFSYSYTFPNNVASLEYAFGGLFISGVNLWGNGEIIMKIENPFEFDFKSKPTQIIENEKTSFHLNTFPNPTNKDILITWSNNKEAKSLEILNQNGMGIKRINSPNNNLQIDLTEFPSGSYLVKLILMDDSIKQTKIIKK